MEPNARLRAAAMARTLDGSQAAWEEFLDEFGESADPRIRELVGLIEHEPGRGGFGGAREHEWLAYRAAVDAAIARLERSEK